MALENHPVVYLKASTCAALLTSQDPLQTYANEAGQNLDPPSSLNNWDPSQGAPAPPKTFRVRAVVSNLLDVPIERADHDEPHGFWSGEPVVEDGNGKPMRKPSTDPAVMGANARVGDGSLDWIDAPPPGYGSVGMWTFDQSVYFLFPVAGASAVLRLSVQNGPDVLICVVINATQFEQNYLCRVVDAGSANDLDAFYNETDALSSSSAGTSTHSNVKVSYRFIDVQTQDPGGFYLFANIEPA